MNPLIQSIFWLSFAATVYTYAVYPAILVVLAALFARKSAGVTKPDDDLPSLSLLIAAHNEQSVIEARIQNALSLDYPADKLDIVIASDGSTDRTNEIVRRFESRGVRLLDFQPNRGKASALNAAIEQLRGQIVLLSDANTHTEPTAARALVRWFADPTIGVVCGRLILTDPHSGKNVDSLYWRYETFLKKQESKLGALLGSNGAIYAIRRELFRPIPGNTIIDDFVIPLLAKLQAGCRIIYDAEAIAHEESAPDVATEFHRRARIGAGGWQAIGLLLPLLNPLRGWVAFTFFSHKVLRWLCPLCMILLLISNLLLIRFRFYQFTLAAQVLFYLTALLGSRAPGSGPLAKLFRLASMFVSMNAALLVGFFRWLRGPQSGAWKRTARQSELGTTPAPTEDRSELNSI